MIWSHKRVSEDEVRSITLLFREQAVSFDPSGQMLLVAVAEDGRSQHLWVRVPDLDLLASYYGFSLCTRAELPLAPARLAGCPEQFARLFQS